MEHINFEGLGLSLDINRVAIDLGFAKIYWYAIFIVLAAALALILCKKDDKKYNIDFENILQLALLVLPISIICARIYFVVFKLDYYIQHPNQLLSINNGGLAIYGGIIGAVITIAIFCKIKKIKVLDMFDFLVPFLALGQAIGRWGNFFNSEAHGPEVSRKVLENLHIPKFVINGMNIDGVYYHPTFFYESIWCLLGFIILIILKKKTKLRRGGLTGIYFIWYGVARFFIESLRTDSLMIGSLKVAQIVSIILCALGLYLLFRKKKDTRLNRLKERMERYARKI